jgi:hypothetical protein
LVALPGRDAEAGEVELGDLLAAEVVLDEGGDLVEVAVEREEAGAR